jgi:hypothetical protein
MRLACATISALDGAAAKRAVLRALATACAPIMGDYYDATRGVWQGVASASAYAFQDDMNMLARPTVLHLSNQRSRNS